MSNQLSLKGYIHDTTAFLQSRNGSTHYFTFLFQINETQKRRAVCYDDSKHKLVENFQESKKPAHIINIKEKPSIFDAEEQHLILGKRSRIEPAALGDVPFEYDTTTSQQPQTSFTAITEIQILPQNHLASVRGIITLDADSVREVIMKDGFLVPMLNRCTITDSTGTIRLTLWGDLIQQASNHKSYSVTQVRIKTYDNAKYLTTTPSTTLTPLEEHFNPPSDQLFQSLFDIDVIFVDRVTLAEAFQTWLSCNKCHHSMTEKATLTETSTIIKCSNCNAVQPISSCATSASVRIAIRNSKYELIWLKAFTPIIEEILHQSDAKLTLDASVEELYEAIFNTKNLTVSYSNTSNIIKKVQFSHPRDAVTP